VDDHLEKDDVLVGKIGNFIFKIDLRAKSDVYNIFFLIFEKVYFDNQLVVGQLLLYHPFTFPIFYCISGCVH
jgi:hypothetical protein